MRSDIYAYAIGILFGVGTLISGGTVSADEGEEIECTKEQHVDVCYPHRGYVDPYAVAYVTLEQADDHYFEGYLQGMIDTLYSEYRINVNVYCGTIFLSHMPCDFVVMDRVVGMICDTPGVKAIRICKRVHREYVGCAEKKILKGRVRCGGEWLPPYGSLFQPLIADPRQVSHSVALRMGDETFGPSLAAISFGNELPIYRWYDVCCPGGMMQIGLEGGLFAVFKLNTPSMDLQNGDYYLGLPLTYSYACWSFRLRLYHISSHLGDEFLVLEEHPGLRRLNPSYEVLDFFTSYQLTKNIRVYGGVGYYLDSDLSFPMQKWYIAYGFEVRIPGGRSACYKLYWEPVLAAYIANRQFQNWNFDVTFFAGVECGRNEFIGNRLRLGVEYHDGFSVDGQFQNLRTTYTSLKLSYYF